MCISKSSASAGKARQAGLTLVELIMFIVVVSVALAGVLLVMNQNLMHSADPLIRKQSLAIAESLLEEIELMPFTYCDPDDPNAATATSTASCTTVEALGPETIPPAPQETRYSTATPFDNVSDYHGFSMTGIKDITNASVSGLGAYSASVAIAQDALPGIPATEALRITVTVTGPDANPVSLQGYRTRHAPNALP